jgi:hypothetical protein
MILLQPLDPTSLLFFCQELCSIKYRGLGTNLPKVGYSVENSICGPPVGTADQQPLTLCPRAIESYKEIK